MFKLTKLQKKPLKSTNAEDMGDYIMTFLNVSFALIFAFIGLFLSIALAHEKYLTSNQ